jgi:hypothetical protein
MDCSHIADVALYHRKRTLAAGEQAGAASFKPMLAISASFCGPSGCVATPVNAANNAGTAVPMADDVSVWLRPSALAIRPIMSGVRNFMMRGDEVHGQFAFLPPPSERLKRNFRSATTQSRVGPWGMVAPRAISCGVEAERELFRVRVSDSAQLFKRFITGRILIRQPIEGCPGSRMESFPNSSADNAIGLSWATLSTRALPRTTDRKTD